MSESRIDEAWILDRFTSVYPAYRLALARLLTRLRHDFDGDLDAMLVLLSVSLGTIHPDWPQGLFGQSAQPRQTRLTNTQSIAETTGIPRESVRRKLAVMEARGWVVRNAQGHWEPTHQAATDLQASSTATVAFLADVVACALAAPQGSARKERPPED